MEKESTEVRVIVDPRRGERRNVRVQATAWLPGQEPVAILIEDLSTYDFRAAIPLDLSERTMIRVSLPNGQLSQAAVERIEDTHVACRFMPPIAARDLQALSTPTFRLDPRRR